MNINKRGEKDTLNKPADKKKIDELQAMLKSSRQAWKEQHVKLKEALKQIRYLQSEVKNLKADNANLEEDYRKLKIEKKQK